MKCYCINCDKKVKPIIKKQNTLLRVKNFNIICPVTILTCPICGEKLYDYKTAKHNDEIIMKVYNKS